MGKEGNFSLFLEAEKRSNRWGRGVFFFGRKGVDHELREYFFLISGSRKGEVEVGGRGIFFWKGEGGVEGEGVGHGWGVDIN